MNITNANEIKNIINECQINKLYLLHKKEEKAERETFINKYILLKGITKKEIKEEIKKINQEIENLVDKKGKSENETNREWYELLIVDKLEKKEKLQKKLIAPKIDKDRSIIEQAKQVPIINFLDFKNGFAKCLWHGPERTASLHYISKDNLCYCFGCGKKGDVIDIVMQLNNCTLPEAIKIILQ